MTGSILRGIGSFYTVLCDEDGQEYTLRAQKMVRHQKMTPMVGDRVRFTPGQGGEDGWHLESAYYDAAGNELR